MRRASTTHRFTRRICVPCAARVLFFLWLSLAFLFPQASAADPEARARMDSMLVQRHQNDRFRSRAEQWKNMNPDEKQTLRRRMDKWNQMAPEERQRYRHRHDQWKGLSPEEQQRIDDKLENWRGLSPAEKEDVRSRFR